MVAQILDGKTVAAQIRNQLQTDIKALTKTGALPPGLAVILIGNDPASKIYVETKRQACLQVGIHSAAYDLPENTSENELVTLIDELNHDKNIHGILVQLPLPKHINSDHILEKISPLKDIDGFHPYNIGRLLQQNPFLRSCTPYGIIKLLQYYQIDLKGLNAAVVGASNIVGRPMALELLMADCTVTICHSQTRDLATHIKSADLVVAAIGHPNIIQTDWIKPGAILIDVGMNRLADNRIVGDIDFNSANEKASWITPVPGGVGPMTVATLLENTYFAYTQRNLCLPKF